jgi:diguanylate cyclase
VFTFGAGTVSRIAGRPVICVVSLLLATVPTILAFGLHTMTTNDQALHSEMFVIETLLVAIVTAMSLQSVRHIYRAMAGSLTAKHELSHLARRDALTGLPNRLMLRERIGESMTNAAAQGHDLAFHMLDLDGFKGVNDRFGHPTGDALLRQVAQRLLEIARAEDTVARLGGDEFVVVQSRVRAPDEAEQLARRIVAQLSLPYDIDGRDVRVSASVGIALAPLHSDHWEGLLTCADAALYRSKAGGKSQFTFARNEAGHWLH